MRLLLASKSPRRRSLIQVLGLNVEVVDIDVKEVVPTDIPIDEVAENIAHQKAMAYDTSLLHDDDILITADTIVVLDNRVLGKPKDEADAKRMLSLLSGNRHTVYTGVCLTDSHHRHSFTEKTDVFFSELTRQEIDNYVDCYKPLDKAGAYGVQEWMGMVGVERIEGCYYNVMGLPISRLYKELQTFVNQEI